MSYIFLVPTAIVYLIGFIVLNGLFEDIHFLGLLGNSLLGF